MGISVFPTPDTDAHADAAGSRRPCAACVAAPGNAGLRGEVRRGNQRRFPALHGTARTAGVFPDVVKPLLAYAKIKGKPDISKF